jgi:hypothetical protein
MARCLELGASRIGLMGANTPVNGRKLFIIFGLLRNSTKIAAQFSGLGQCSQNPPENDEKLKLAARLFTGVVTPFSTNIGKNDWFSQCSM